MNAGATSALRFRPPWRNVAVDGRAYEHYHANRQTLTQQVSSHLLSEQAARAIESRIERPMTLYGRDFIDLCW